VSVALGAPVLGSHGGSTHLQGQAFHKEKAFIAKALPKVRKRLPAAFKRMLQKGFDSRDLRRPMSVDIYATKPHWMHGRSPCLTRAMVATGYYPLVRGPRLFVKERLRLQELPAISTTFVAGMSAIGSSGR
jgi:hypothetical protein